MLDNVVRIAKEICCGKYPDATVTFLAGSIVRGEGTPYSDLDLVVIFDELPNAYRESFYFQDYPVEAFVHDPETLHYFIERERVAGLCIMAQMVSEGIELPETCALSQSLKEFAHSVISAQPPELSEEDLRKARYNITNLIDDIRSPRSKEEAVASGTLLYESLANCYLRINNLWEAKGKTIPRKLKLADSEFCLRFCGGFQKLFAGGETEEVIALSEEILEPIGGFLFEGHKLNAPPDNRKAFS